MGKQFHEQTVKDALAAAGLSTGARKEVLRVLGIGQAKVRRFEVVVESDVEYSRNATIDGVIKDALGDLDGVVRVKTRSAGPGTPAYRWSDSTSFESA